jgi:hypothetical protein
VLNNTFGGGPHKVRVCIHGMQSNSIIRVCLT